MNDWRQDPATDAQKKRLKDEGIKFSSSISKGEASDLIGGTIEPEEHQIAILKFFKVSGISKLSQTDAREKIDLLFAKPENKERWEDRPADNEQKEIFRFFSLEIPPKLKYSDAKQIISELFDDEAKLEAWEKREDEIFEREAWFEDSYEMMNEVRNLYNCKKVSKKLFQQIVESLEASGMTLDQIERDEDFFFRKALEINPKLRKAAPVRKNSPNTSRSRKKSGSGVTGIAVVVIIVLIMLAFI